MTVILTHNQRNKTTLAIRRKSDPHANILSLLFRHNTATYLIRLNFHISEKIKKSYHRSPAFKQKNKNQSFTPYLLVT